MFETIRLCDHPQLQRPLPFGERWQVSPPASVPVFRIHAEEALELPGYVMTVGSFRPVNSLSFEIARATSAIGLTTSNACWLRSPLAGSYFSRYMRMVAPATP